MYEAIFRPHFLLKDICMKALFLHQNFPGQFKHLAPALAGRGDDVSFITHPEKPSIKGIRKIEYKPHRAVTEKIHPYLASTEAGIINGQNVARACLALRERGETPDVVIGNPGWGEALFVKDVWPDVPLLLLVEFYYRSVGSDVNFDPEFQTGPDGPFRTRTRNAYHLLSIEAADHAYAPTHWQRQQFPEAFHDKIDVIHDGIDTEVLKPDDTATVTLPNGTTLSRKDEVLTYVSRNLEPYRGFHSFMRALPEVLKARPDAHVVIVGGDEVSYGRKPSDGGSWREVLTKEIGGLPDRVHFLGRIPYDDYLSVLRISSVHPYFTYPFVLSWSMLEAMSSGCFVVGSDTPPVREVIEHNKNGWLVDFFDTKKIAFTLAEALEQRNDVGAIREAARQTIQNKYNLNDMLSQQISLIDRLAGAAK